MRRARGHILLMCVKCHPELAGVGIENTWGKSAIHFRRNNDCIAKNLDANVQNSLHSDNLPLLEWWRGLSAGFERALATQTTILPESCALFHL